MSILIARVNILNTWALTYTQKTCHFGNQLENSKPETQSTIKTIKKNIIKKIKKNRRQDNHIEGQGSTSKVINCTFNFRLASFSSTSPASINASIMTSMKGQEVQKIPLN